MSTNGRMDTLWNIPKMEYYKTMKMNDLKLQATIPMNPTNIKISKKKNKKQSHVGACAV